MKVAPLWHALRDADWCKPALVHTGQHHDPEMSDVFFRDLRLPAPDVHLGAMGGTHAEHTANVLVAYERALEKDRPAWVVVVGDVNSTLAAALSAKKLGLPVAHLEAGLRSGDRSMPEEINRVATDAIADLHWTPSDDGDANLLREGVDPARIVRVGNVMIDAFELARDRIEATRADIAHGFGGARYVVATFHRPVNVDTPGALREVVEDIEGAAKHARIAFPVHPRTRDRLRRFGLEERLAGNSNVTLLPPLGYVEFMSLVTHSQAVITDSGGIQEETTYLGIPCLTARETTERPITITHGTNRLVRRGEVASALASVLERPPPRRDPPALWDGHAAKRAAASLREALQRAP